MISTETSKKKILLIDDDEIYISLVENILDNNYKVHSAKSGKEALDSLLKGLIPDLILLDIIMPEMDGWETFNRIKGISLLHDVPIAFITSLNDTTGLRNAYKIGAVDYIAKPYDREFLLERVQNIIDSHAL